ncbi:MAG: 2OG-Fe dioxygenase family protein [Anaerolineae bacterium]
MTIERSIRPELEEKKFALMDANELMIAPELSQDKEQLWASWNNLEADNYLRDGASYRLRRFGLFYWHPASGDLRLLPPAPYFQSAETNSYAGGIDRQFAYLEEETGTNQFLHELIKFTFRQFPVTDEMFENPWEIDVHQFRIVSSEAELGEPTPEGIHHDDDDFNAIYLVRRDNVSGGVNSVYDNQRNPLASLTLSQPMDSVLVWDPHVMHGVSSIYPTDPKRQGIRDVLVIGYNHNPGLELSL